MSIGIISTLVIKDLTLFFRNRFFAVITALGLVFFIGIYFLMPKTLDETLEIGFYAPNLPAVIIDELNQEGVIIREMDSEEALRSAVAAGDFSTGVVLPPDWAQQLAAGQQEQVKLYFSSEFPDDFKEIYVILIQELAFMVSGERLNVEFDEEFLGVDRAGEQVSIRGRMLPLLAVFILIMETMGLASLISTEIEGGTIQALLITPLRVEGLFLSKGLTGVSFAFLQAFLLMLITGGFSKNPLIILVALLLGSILVTGIGFLIAAVSKDMLSVIGWGILALVILVLPALGILIPGTVSEWVKIIPSYYLVDTVYQAANFIIGWKDVATNLLMLLAFSALFFALGIVVLRRKFR